jgi:hypothetical protein
MVYPGCTPELRILVKPDGTQVLQMRHINITTGYTGKWQDVPVVLESTDNENTHRSTQS